MLMLVIAVIVLAFSLYMCTYFCKGCAPSLFGLSRRIAKEVLLTLILFNCFNFAYSAGLHFSYALPEDSLYTAGTLAALSVIVMPVLMAIALLCTED